MLFTLADARTALGRFVDQGSCNTTVIDQRINEAIARLMDMEDWTCLQKMVRIWVQNRIFSLPQTVEKIIRASIDGDATKIFGHSYQFLSSGPGDLDHLTCITPNIIDRGANWPVMYDIPDGYTIGTTDYDPGPLPLLVRSTSSADTSLTLQVRGYNAQGEEISEEVPILQWEDGTEGELTGTFTAGVTLSTNSFAEITRVIKPKTTGHICLYAVDPATNFFSFLAKYRPSDEIPAFRRYALTTWPSESETQQTYVLALVRLRAVPLVADDDIVPIDSMHALKLMVMAIREENAGNLQGSTNLEMQARRLMQERQTASTMAAGTTVVMDIDFDFSLGNLYPGYII